MNFLDRLMYTAGRVLIKEIEEALREDGGKRNSKGCLRVWLREFRNHPGGVHLVIGRQRSGKTALCYWLAQNTGRKPVYAMTAAKEVPLGTEVIYDIDRVPPGGVVVVDDASLFFNSMRTKKTDDNYQLLRDLLIFTEKQDLCVLFNAHDTSLLNKTAFSQAKSIFFKEPNLMALDSERPGVREILKLVQQGFDRIRKGTREAYFYLYSSDCKGWGKFPLPAGWSQKISTSCGISDAEFSEVRDLKDGAATVTDQSKPEDEDFKKFLEDKKKEKEARKREKELREFEEWKQAREGGDNGEGFEEDGH